MRPAASEKGIQIGRIRRRILALMWAQQPFMWGAIICGTVGATAAGFVLACITALFIPPAVALSLQSRRLHGRLPPA